MRPRLIAIILARLSPVLLLPALAFLLGPQFLPMLMIPMLMVAPALLFRDDDASDGSGSDEGGGGGGPGPRQPDVPPDSPSGGAPLPDAEPTRTRLRDHGRTPRVTPPRRHRAQPEPARRPARAPSRSRSA